jgi:hypothetical protein
LTASGPRIGPGLRLGVGSRLMPPRTAENLRPGLGSRRAANPELDRPGPDDRSCLGLGSHCGPLRRVLQPSERPLFPDDPERERDGARPALSVRHGLAGTIPRQRRQVAHGHGLRWPPSRPRRGSEDRKFWSSPLGIAVECLRWRGHCSCRAYGHQTERSNLRLSYTRQRSGAPSKFIRPRRGWIYGQTGPRSTCCEDRVTQLRSARPEIQAKAENSA